MVVLTYMLRWLSVIVLVALQACSTSGLPNSTTPNGAQEKNQSKSGRAPIPGGYWMYSFGVSQKPEELANVEIAQSYYGIWAESRSWARITPGSRASATRIGLQSYYSLYARWRLKDGREFILENVDVAPIMHEYFSNKNLQLQWQREGRPRHKVGDFEPLLAHEINGDSLILKWVITINRTPVNERLTASGAATPWDTYDEEHVVAVLKGHLTSGIDFRKTYERRQ